MMVDVYAVYHCPKCNREENFDDCDDEMLEYWSTEREEISCSNCGETMLHEDDWKERELMIEEVKE